MSENPIFIIAEAGVNHNGSLSEAFRLVDAAKKAGADAVKFQSFKATELASISTPKVDYQKQDKQHNSHFEMLEALELNHEQQEQIYRYCKQSEIEFMSTPYSISELNFLKDLGVQKIKTASADIVDIPLHLEIANSNLEIIASTGMASDIEIAEVVKIYKKSQTPLTLLHCTSEYPTSHLNSKIRRLITLKENFGCAVGFSDHTLDTVSAILSLALGAQVFEKHLTINKHANGPDHAASLDAQEFVSYVNDLRNAQIVFSSTNFRRTASEEQMAYVSRKSLHFTRDIDAGVTIKHEHLRMIRPNNGITWLKGMELIGKSLTKAVLAGEPVSLSHFSIEELH